MNEEELEYVYKQIVDIVVKTIPVNWIKVYLYGEVVEGSQTAYFYFYLRKMMISRSIVMRSLNCLK